MAEIVIAAAIIGIGIAGILAAFVGYQRAAGRVVPQTVAAFMAEEGIEAVHLMRDNDWSATIGAYSIGTPYYLAWEGGTWTATTTATSTDGHYRTVTFYNVYRDSNDQISPSGTLDPDTRLAVASTTWWGGTATSSVALFAYVSNLFDY